MSGSVTPVPASAISSIATAFDEMLDPAMKRALDVMVGRAPLLAGMASYHLGFVDATFAPAVTPPEQRGKRIRPGVAMLACAAAGGAPNTAAPLAAAIELLHNFTLIHDDIQDQSPTRRHRPTVWTLWGIGQAINAGDALFAAAHRALYQLRESGVEADLIVELADRFDAMTVEIVQGQTLDLGFEGRNDVSSDDYLEMIRLKTAVIVEFAAWAGAMLASGDHARAERFGRFGLAVGIGFQVQDDLLGIWGTSESTGKAAADDIRRRKQSLPILMLRERATPAERLELDAIFAAADVDEAGIRTVLGLLDQYEVRRDLELQIQSFHDDALPTLAEAAVAGENTARDALAALVDALSTRQH